MASAGLPEEELTFLREVVTEYVFTKMPIRMIKLKTMELIERSEVTNELFNRAREESSITAALERWRRASDNKKEREEVGITNTVHKLGGYAILSHTWFPGEQEVLYKDTEKYPDWATNEEFSASKGKGFSKLKKFCQIACEEPYNAIYGWVDTICIDKRSTSELDESIRSMYRWYFDSALCIVYLAQTTAEGFKGMDADRWFTRGWTLQEYLAPKVIKFHDKDWRPLTPHPSSETSYINDKFPYSHLGFSPTPRHPTEIQRIIYKATSIPPFNEGPDNDRSLHPSSGLRPGDIIKRMQWASRRKTTRLEDRAYSLMGIFAVSFPIAYGEGPERAFFRLVEAILATKPAEQVRELLSWGGRPLPPEIHTSRLLPSQPECYEGNGVNVPEWVSAHSGEDRPPPEPTMLTHIGLRVRLLVASCSRAQDQEGCDGYHQVRFNAPRAAHLEIQPFIVDRIYSTTESEVISTTEPKYLLAIHTFIEDDINVRIPRTGLAFLLQWYPPSPRQTYLTDENMASVYLSARSKVETRKPIVFTRHCNSLDGYSTLSKKRISAENMLPVSLYL